MKHTHGD